MHAWIAESVTTIKMEHRGDTHVAFVAFEQGYQRRSRHLKDQLELSYPGNRAKVLPREAPLEDRVRLTNGPGQERPFKAASPTLVA